MSSLPSAVPKGFPVGRLRLSRQLGDSLRRGGAPSLRRPIPLISPYGGPAPKWDGKAPVENVRETIRARGEGGTLRQFVTAKTHPTELKTQYPPQMSTMQTPSEFSNPEVQRGQGVTRDADVSKAALERLAEILKLSSRRER